MNPYRAFLKWRIKRLHKKYDAAFFPSSMRRHKEKYERLEERLK